MGLHLCSIFCCQARAGVGCIHSEQKINRSQGGREKRKGWKRQGIRTSFVDVAENNYEGTKNHDLSIAIKWRGLRICHDPSSCQKGIFFQCVSLNEKGEENQNNSAHPKAFFRQDPGANPSSDSMLVQCPNKQKQIDLPVRKIWKVLYC